MKLVNLVIDLRKAVKAPAMKIVVATTGFGGRELAGFTKDAQKEAIGKVIAAQMALASAARVQRPGGSRRNP